ncbi:hypothetical protein [Alloalcanivorax venustensis]|jgi:hypothetical protein
MLKGLAIMAPVIGRISIGRIVKKDGWIKCALDYELRKTTGNG